MIHVKPKKKDLLACSANLLACLLACSANLLVCSANLLACSGSGQQTCVILCKLTHIIVPGEGRGGLNSN